jgi:arsenical pump membrane protein
LRKARAKPLPYLLICAFIANAASFVLPISNPANLVVYGSKMPPLLTWLRSFGPASIASIAATFVLLRFAVRADLRGEIARNVEDGRLSAAGKRAAWGIAGAGVTLIAASAFNIDLGLPTFLTAVAVAALVTMLDRGAPRAILRYISWSVLPLVAGLFVLVEAVKQAGALTLSEEALKRMTGLTAAFGVALLSNIANNLPVGLLAAGALQRGVVSTAIKNAVLIGVDLGPNLSVTGSLATILWLVALRRDGEDVSFGRFLAYGALVMPPALALAVLASYI